MANTISIQLGSPCGIFASNSDYTPDGLFDDHEESDLESPVLKYFFDETHARDKSKSEGVKELKKVTSRVQRLMEGQFRHASVLGPCSRALNLQAWGAARNPDGQIDDWLGLLQRVRRGGVEPLLRVEVWPLLLGCISPTDTHEKVEATKALAEREWFQLQLIIANKEQLAAEYKSKGAVETWDTTEQQIVIDTVRVDREAEPFRGATRQTCIARLEAVLRAYALTDPATGYCQGMTDLAAPFLQVFDKDWQVFWCFKALMAKRNQNFHEGMNCMKSHMQHVRCLLRKHDMTLFQHLVKLGGDGCEMTFQMLLLVMRREVCWHDVFMLWENLWACELLTQCDSFLVYCVAALFCMHRDAILNLPNLEELVKFVNNPPRPMDVIRLCADAMMLYKQDVSTSADMAVRSLNLTDPGSPSSVPPPMVTIQRSSQHATKSAASNAR